MRLLKTFSHETGSDERFAAQVVEYFSKPDMQELLPSNTEYTHRAEKYSDIIM